MSVKLSVIIPCLNEERMISTALDALAVQTFDGDWEIIIADNGSTDKTLKIAEDYKSILPNLKIIDASAARGAAHARNKGVLAASGELIAFCDADDEVTHDWVENIYESILKYDFVASRLDSEKLSDPKALEAKGNKRQRTGLIKYFYVDYFPHADVCGMGVKKSIHLSVGGFDETMLYCEDCDYCWRIQLKGVSLHFEPNALVNNRHQSGSVNRIKQAKHWGEYNVLLNKKFRPLGMPTVSWKFGISLWWNLIKHFTSVFKKSKRESWLWNFSYRFGHLYGSIKYKILVL